MFVSGSESLGNSVPVYRSGLTSFRCPFLKNLFKEFSGFVVYCSVINVLFVVAVSCDSFYIISKRFMFVNNFFISFLLLWSNPSRDSFNRIPYPSWLVNSFFICFCNSFSFTVLSELIRCSIPEILQLFKMFVRMTPACHSLVSVSISERMLSYHGFLELSMLFLYFAQFRIFWHLKFAFYHSPFSSDFQISPC